MLMCTVIVIIISCSHLSYYIIIILFLVISIYLHPQSVVVPLTLSLLCNSTRVHGDLYINVGSTYDWSFIQKQIGMFCYSGLNEDQVRQLQSEHAIYMTKDGRISMVSLTPDNVGYVSKAIHEVTK